MNKLFAFNVSKEVVGIPTVSFVYDSDKQVTTWIGDATVVASSYCTQMPYNGRKCLYSGSTCVGWISLGVVPKYYNSQCDGF